MKISKNSKWDEENISVFLREYAIPIRLAVMKDGYPLICSVWFIIDPDQLVLRCVSHVKSQLIQSLMINPRLGFEIAVNEPPYKGVRGRGAAKLTQNDVNTTLNSVIVRFLGDSKSALAQWLISRVAQEYVIEIRPEWITSWDYSERM